MNRILDCEFFDNSYQLIDFVNQYNIKHEDIQCVFPIGKYGRIELIYWKLVEGSEDE